MPSTNLGAAFVETVALPPDYDRYYSRGEREKCRYRLSLGTFDAEAEAKGEAA